MEQKLYRISVPIDSPAVRLKEFLRTSIQDLSSRNAMFAVNNGLVTDATGKAITNADLELVPGTELTVDLRHGIRGEGKPKRTELGSRAQVVHDDEHLVVVNKSAGVLVQPVPDDEQKGAPLVELLKHYWLSKGQPPINPIVVQRLDFETSGLLVLAKNTEIAAELQKQLLPPRRMKRTYLALAYGSSKLEKVTWKTHLGRGQTGVRQSVSQQTQKNAKEAVTHVRRKEDLRNATLFEVTLETGRTHQIRIHLAEAGHPLVGDHLYRRLSEWIIRKAGEPDFKAPKGKGPMVEAVAVAAAGGLQLPDKKKDADRTMLHAYKLSFIHPIFEKEMSFEVDPPEDFERMWRKLKLTGRETLEKK